MFETILGAIFIIGLFVFTVYGLPKLGFRIRGKRVMSNYIPKECAKNFHLTSTIFKLPKNTVLTETNDHNDSECSCHCHNRKGGCSGKIEDNKEFRHIYCSEKCTHCTYI